MQHSSINSISVFDPSEAALQDLKNQYQGINRYTSFENMFENEDLDIAVICSPPQFHLDQAKLALDHECDVLIEKPVVMSKDEADELNQYQADCDSVITAVHNKKYRPGPLKAKNLVETEKIGELTHFHIDWWKDWSTDRMAQDPSHWSHQLTGGRLAEHLPHSIYMPYHFMGELELIEVNCKRYDGELDHIEVESATILLDAEQGYVTIRYVGEKDGYKSYNIRGTDGYLHVGRLYVEKLNREYQPERILNTTRNYLNEIKNFSRAVYRKIDNEIGLPISPKSSHERLINNFIQYTKGNGENPVSWDEAYHTICLVEEIGEEIEQLKSPSDAQK